MKSTYQMIFFVSLVVLVLLSLTDLAAPRDEFIASKLAQNPSKWEMTFGDNDWALQIHANPDEAKSLLVKFLNRNRYPAYRDIAHIEIGLLIICAFSLIGWIRERRIEKKAPNKVPHAIAGEAPSQRER